MAFLPIPTMKCKNGQLWAVLGARRTGEWWNVRLNRTVVGKHAEGQRYNLTLSWNGERYAEGESYRWAERFIPELLEKLPDFLAKAGNRWAKRETARKEVG